MIALTAGLVVVLMVGLIPRLGRFTMRLPDDRRARHRPPGCRSGNGARAQDLVAGALRLDAFGLAATLIACFAAAVAVVLSIREPAAEEAGFGAFYSLLLGSVLGMTLIAQAQNLIAFFVALELLSIPLYVLCASARRTERSLESGLKYLVIGSIGSATVLYGFALLYGGSGSTDFAGIAKGLAGDNGNDTIVLIGVAMVATGLAFKTSVAPFHQWTPDVYQGAPTPITAFMAVATKAAALHRPRAALRGGARPDRRRLEARARRARCHLDRRRQHRRARPGLPEAAAGLLGHRPGRLHARRDRGRDRDRPRGPRLLPRRLHADEPGRLRRGGRPRARDRPRRRHRGARRHRPHPPAARLAADDRDARPRRAARHLGVHGQAVPDRGDASTATTPGSASPS